MAEDTLPTIAADPERPGRTRGGRSRGGRGGGGSSSLLFVKAILVVLVAAVLGAGFFIFEQHRRLADTEAALAQATGRIATLEERASLSEQLMSASDTDLLAKLEEHFGQIDLLWGNYRKHRNNLTALEAKDKSLQTALTRADAAVTAAQGKIAALETAVARQKDIGDRLTELDMQVQRALAQLREVVDRANAAYQIASRVEDSLGGDVAGLKSAIDAIDAHRAQVNADIAELKRQVNELRFASP